MWLILRNGKMCLGMTIVHLLKWWAVMNSDTASITSMIHWVYCGYMWRIHREVTISSMVLLINRLISQFESLLGVLAEIALVLYRFSLFYSIEFIFYERKLWKLILLFYFSFQCSWSFFNYWHFSTFRKGSFSLWIERTHSCLWTSCLDWHRRFK